MARNLAMILPKDNSKLKRAFCILTDAEAIAEKQKRKELQKNIADEEN